MKWVNIQVTKKENVKDRKVIDNSQVIFYHFKEDVQLTLYNWVMLLTETLPVNKIDINKHYYLDEDGLEERTVWGKNGDGQ